MSQASYNVPTSGSMSMVTFAGLMNGAYNALATGSSGASAPANGPGSAPQALQCWWNTSSVNWPVLNVFDGVNWDSLGTLDVVDSNWFPKFGGGTATVSSSGSINLSTVPHNFVTIINAGTITSFGSGASIGQKWHLQFANQAVITYGASSILTPGSANIITNTGDSCIAMYLGSGVWTIYNYVRGLSSPGMTLPTGATFWMPAKNLYVPGAVRANGLTIGDGLSGATELAASYAFALYVYLWTNFSQPSGNTLCPVTGGVGSSAAADFNAHKALQLFDLRGRMIAGLDDMGNSAASRLSSATMSPNGTTALATGGSETGTLSTANLPPYTPSGSVSAPSISISGGTLGGTTQNAISAAGGTTNIVVNATTITATSSTPSFTGTPQGGTSTPINKMPPAVLGTWYVVL